MKIIVLLFALMSPLALAGCATFPTPISCTPNPHHIPHPSNGCGLLPCLPDC